MTNGGFSDSQFGDIADEENYTGLAPADLFTIPLQAAAADGVNEDSSNAFFNYGRPTAAGLSGKYTSCTNKNESLTSQANKRLVTMRALNNVS